MKKAMSEMKTERIYYIIAIVILVFLIGIAACFYMIKHAQHNIGYVETPTLIKNYKRAIDFKKEYELKARQNKMRLDTLITEFKLSANLLEQKKKSLRPEKFNEEKKLLESKGLQVSNYKDYILESSRKEDERITAQIMKEISDCVKRYGQEKKYTLILVNNNTGGGIGYADEQINVTQEIIEIMNNEYQRNKK